MSLAKLSAIIPCYQCEDTIAKAVASVDAQTMRPKELILVDDCSGDGTSAALKAAQLTYGEEWIKVVFLEKNLGCGGARNKGWDVATQPYVAFLDADDIWDPQKIETQLGWMHSHPDVLYTGHPFRVTAHNNDYQPIYFTRQPVFKRVQSLRLLLSNQFAASSIMAKRELPYRYAFGRRRTEDYLLSCQMCLDGNAIYRCDQELGAHFKAVYGEGGLSDDLWLMEKSELSVYRDLYRAQRLNLISLSFLYAWSLIRHVRRFFIVAWTSGK